MCHYCNVLPSLHHSGLPPQPLHNSTKQYCHRLLPTFASLCHHSTCYNYFISFTFLIFNIHIKHLISSVLFLCTIGFLLITFLVFLDVSLNVEIKEESEEQGSMEEDYIAVILGKVTLNEDWKCSMDEEGCKLS